MTDEVKKEEKGKKEEKKEVVKEVKEVIVRSSKAKPLAPIDPRTGTRFEPGSARQIAFDIMYKAVKEGKKVKEIRDILANSRKDKGCKYNLDAAYLNFTVASHLEMFKVFSDGVVKIVKEPQVDPAAAKKFEEEKEARRKSAEEAREKRRKEKVEKDGKAEGKKEVKKEEKVQPVVDKKPSKVEAKK